VSTHPAETCQARFLIVRENPVSLRRSCCDKITYSPIRAPRAVIHENCGENAPVIAVRDHVGVGRCRGGSIGKNCCWASGGIRCRRQRPRTFPAGKLPPTPMPSFCVVSAPWVEMERRKSVRRNSSRRPYLCARHAAIADTIENAAAYSGFHPGLFHDCTPNRAGVKSETSERSMNIVPESDCNCSRPTGFCICQAQLERIGVAVIHVGIAQGGSAAPRNPLQPEIEIAEERPFQDGRARRMRNVSLFLIAPSSR